MLPIQLKRSQYVGSSVVSSSQLVAGTASLLWHHRDGRSAPGTDDRISRVDWIEGVDRRDGVGLGWVNWRDSVGGAFAVLADDFDGAGTLWQVFTEVGTAIKLAPQVCHSCQLVEQKNVGEDTDHES